MWRATGGLAALMVLAGCGGSPADSVRPAATATHVTHPSWLTVHGAVTVPAGEFASSDDAECQVSTGYDDVADGGQVTVTGPKGDVVAIGQVSAAPGNALICQFPFEVDSVPAGLGFYGVAVGHRNAVQFRESALAEFISLKVG